MKKIKHKGKKGALLDEETVQMLLAAVGIAILIVLLYALLRPYINKEDETLKGYMGLLQEATASADAGAVGEFLIYQDQDAALVYFGNSSVAVINMGGEDLRFTVPSTYQNFACMCRKSTAAGGKVCNKKFCISLKHPAVYNDGVRISEKFGIGFNQRVFIKKENDKYVFNKPFSYFVVSQEASGILSSVSDLYFQFSNGNWSWSPDKINWMKVPVLVVSGGDYNGKSPNQKNIEIIKQLENKNFEEGKEILIKNSKEVNTE